MLGLRTWFKAMPHGFVDIIGNLKAFPVGSPSRYGPKKQGGLGCLNLPTGSDYMTVTENASLRPADRWTVSAWCRLNGTASTYANIFDYTAKNGATSPYHSYKIGVNHGSNPGQIYSIEIGTSSNNTNSIYTSNAVSTSTYDHVAITWGGNVATENQVKFYLNGIYISQVTTNTIYYDTPNTFYIGNGFPGQIDDIMIYHKCLYATEIKALYLTGLQGYPGVFNYGKIETKKYTPVIASDWGAGQLLSTMING